MNYTQMRDYLKKAAKAGSKFGTDTTKRILAVLGNPQDKIKCVHIAGTNGKGSTTAMLQAVLMAAGYKVGMYTSPALEEFEEIIRINDENIHKDALCSVVKKVKEAAEVVESQGFASPSEFEILTPAMYLYFYQQQVDIALVETGLGGELDATNVMIPLISIITSISYDHMSILGNSLADIAKAKCGIIKKAVPVITIEQPEEAALVIVEQCRIKESPLIIAHESQTVLQKILNYKQKIMVKTSKDEYKVELNLIGLHQVKNVSLAINAVEVLQREGFNISKENVLTGLNSVTWKGRMEIVKTKPIVVLDGAHNIDGFKFLCENIKTYFKYGKLYLIIGILADKQVEDMVSAIAPMAEHIFTLAPENERAETAKNLMKRIAAINESCEACEDYGTAYEKAVNLCGDNDIVLGCGSLYMIGKLRKIITGAM